MKHQNSVGKVGGNGSFCYFGDTTADSVRSHTEKRRETEPDLYIRPAPGKCCPDAECDRQFFDPTFYPESCSGCGRSCEGCRHRDAKVTAHNGANCAKPSPSPCLRGGGESGR